MEEKPQNSKKLEEQINNFGKKPINPNGSGWFVGEGTDNITLLSGLALQGLLANPNNANKNRQELAKDAYDSAMELVKIIVNGKFNK